MNTKQIGLAALLGLGVTANGYGAEQTPKEKVEKAVEYMKRLPQHEWGWHEDSFTHNEQNVTFYFNTSDMWDMWGLEHGLSLAVSLPLGGQVVMKDSSSNGYGSVDGLLAWTPGYQDQEFTDGELLKKANEAYSRIIDAYVKHIEEIPVKKAAAKKKIAVEEIKDKVAAKKRALEEVKDMLDKLAK